MSTNAGPAPEMLPPNVMTIFTLPADVDPRTFELVRDAIGQMISDTPQFAVLDGDLHTETVKADGTRVRGNVLHRDDLTVLKGYTIVVDVQMASTWQFRLASAGARFLAGVLSRVTGVPCEISLVAPEGV